MGPGTHGAYAYLQVAKSQAWALATVTPPLMVDSVQDGEAVQVVAREGAQCAKQPGEQVVSRDSGTEKHTLGQHQPEHRNLHPQLTQKGRSPLARPPQDWKLLSPTGWPRSRQAPSCSSTRPPSAFQE